MSTFKTKTGKTTAVSILALTLICVAIWIASCLVTGAYASGEKYVTRTFVIPFNGESYKTIVFRDRDTGNVINGTTGASAAATTWDSGEIAGTQHAVSNDWTFTVPATNVDRVYFTIYDVAPASIDKTTVPPYSPILYDPANGMAFTDTLPLSDNKVRMSTVN